MNQDDKSCDVYIEYLTLSNFLSFGRTRQILGPFAKVNLFIGQNNSGKSNILRWIKEFHYQFLDLFPYSSGLPLQEDILHRSVNAESEPPRIGIGFSHEGPLSQFLQQKYGLDFWTQFPMTKVREKYRSEGNALFSIFDFIWNKKGTITYAGPDSFEVLANAQSAAFRDLVGRLGLASKTPEADLLESLKHFLFLANRPKTVILLPAFRKIGQQPSSSKGADSTQWESSGADIVHRLAYLQNPDSNVEHCEDQFRKFNKFVQEVTGHPEALVQIPDSKTEVRVRLRGRQWKLENLGTGIHQVILIAAFCTVTEDSIICLEEPELHLHPSLQRALIRYLALETNNQYFITSHSSAFIDLKLPSKSIFHVRMEEGETKVLSADTDEHKISAFTDLGYQPSDLLQTNCVIWVEGPSDRIYLNYWMRGKDSSLIENVHYSIMFYGGSLRRHLKVDYTVNESSILEQAYGEVDSFIDLRRLNQRMIFVLDSDLESLESVLTPVQQKLLNAFDKEPGFCWITAGRTIEHYLPREEFRQSVMDKHSLSKLPVWQDSKYEVLVKRIQKTKENKENLVDIDKVGCARSFVSEHPSPNYSQHDLEKMIERTIQFIRESNKGVLTLKGEPERCITCGN